jgi:ankyrin repeat protein
MQLSFTTLTRNVVLLALALVPGPPLPTTGSLFDAVRRDDLATVKMLVRGGSDVNASDEAGATPLMYASLYSSLESMRFLIDHGAQVNAANKFGATVLMWAAPRTPEVKLLIQRGANVNARATNGSTPVLVATRAGNADAVKLLIEAGADVTSQEIRTGLLTTAYAFAGANPATREVLRHAHVMVASAKDIKGPAIANNVDNASLVEQLLESGVPADEVVPRVTAKFPSFFFAAREGHVESMRALVHAGFNPTMAGPRGWTALMMAAGSDRAGQAALQFLIDQGGDVNAADADGRTALDWALTRGETGDAALLRAAGAHTNAAPPAAPVSIASPRTVADAIEKAVARLQPADIGFSAGAKCNSCHNQILPGIAVALAKRRGIKVDDSLENHSIQLTQETWTTLREEVLLGDTYTGGGRQASISYGLLELSERHEPATPITDAMLLGLANNQLPDGSWEGNFDSRPPLDRTPIVATALAIRNLRDYAPRGRRDEMETRIARARQFLRHAKPGDTQDTAFRLLGLIWSGCDGREIASARTSLLALQREDGGWAQTAAMTSDAYATGQALYALHAAGMPAAEGAYRKGTAYLLRNQLEDGTWFVPSRAFGFQKYFETGFPHGRSQFISAAATSWAVIGLSYALN